MKSLVIIMILSVFLFFPISAYAEISIETDNPNYGVTDVIRITGYIENFETFYDSSAYGTVSDPLTITFYQNNKEIFSDSFTYWNTQDDLRYIIDGHFSSYFLPKYQIPIDWTGEYTVTATYQEQSASTTFSFVGTDTFQGLTSLSEDGRLQIDNSEYEINNTAKLIKVNGICSCFFPTRSLVFELSNGISVIDSKEFSYENPIIKVPDGISEKLSNRVGSVMHPISTQFELSDNLPSGTYFIEMYRPPIPFTADEISDCEYLGFCSGKNIYEHIPKIKFTVTNISENQNKIIIDDDLTQNQILDSEPKIKCGEGTIEKDGKCVVDTKLTVDVEPTPEPQLVCGDGTIEKDGKCVVDTTKPTAEKASKGGGCLIATATYGSELAPQVQQLRELRDNQLLQTSSGTSFMKSFNEFYYSFSPTIADWERESPIFKEVVKITLTPMISSLSILNHVDMDSEESVLGYGISLILLNVGMYFVAPVVVINTIRKNLNP